MCMCLLTILDLIDSDIFTKPLVIGTSNVIHDI
jgi:hypothetical protein